MNMASKLKKRATQARSAVEERDPEAYARRTKSERFFTDAEIFLENPTSSTGAKLFAGFILLCIFLSTFSFCAETLPEWEMLPLWHYLEVMFVTIFSFEYVARIYFTSKPRTAFVCEPMNVIDLVAILPFYIEIFLAAVLHEDTTPPDLRVLRALRLTRVFKFGRYSEELQFIGLGVLRSMNSFYLMGMMLGVGLVFFAAMLWIADRGDWDEEKHCYVRHPVEPHYSGCSPYQSLPNSLWWAITTMSTVGYGDAYPMSAGGRFIAGIAMVAGILCVALPTTVLGVEFGDLYIQTTQEAEDQKRRLNLTRLNKRELELLDKLRTIDRQAKKLKKTMPYVQLLLLIKNENLVNKYDIDATLEMMTAASCQNLKNLKRFCTLCSAKDGKTWV